MATSESNLEKYFVRKINERGGWAIKLLGMKGWPDRTVLLPGGRVYFVELKTDTGRLSKMQKYVHRKLADMGIEVVVLKGREEIDAWLMKLN